MSAPTTLPTQRIDHAAAQAHLPTSLPPTDQLLVLPLPSAEEVLVDGLPSP
jgi:hypothetical protein